MLTVKTLQENSMAILRPLFKYLIIPAVLILFGAYVERNYAKREALTIPLTVYDVKGNKLHLEEPRDESDHREYPIILYGKDDTSGRIDIYAYKKELGLKFKKNVPGI